MSLTSFVTGKYLKSKKDSRLMSLISVISIGGIALGVAVLIIALTVLEGFEKAVSEKIVDFNSHIYITGFGKRDLFGPEMVKLELGEDLRNEITSLVPFISKSSIIKSNDFYEGVELIGLPDTAGAGIEEFITEGKFSFEGTKNNGGIVIGRKLADRLMLNIGDKITIFSLLNNQPPSITNPPIVEQFIINGIFSSGMAEYDDLRIYISFDQAGEIFRMGDLVSGYNVRVKNTDRIEVLADRMSDRLGYPFYVRSIYKQYINIFTWLELQKAPIPVILSLITLVAAFNIVGTILMIIIEKTSAVGTLKALGADQRAITSIFVRMGIYLSLTGIIIGNVTALLLSIIQVEFNIVSLPSDVYFLSGVPISIDPFNYMIVSGVAFIICLMASYIPARYAARLSPVKALRFD